MKINKLVILFVVFFALSLFFYIQNNRKPISVCGNSICEEGEKNICSQDCATKSEEEVVPRIKTTPPSVCGDSLCYDMKVFCGDIPDRRAMIKEYRPEVSIGTIVLMGDGEGTEFYSGQSNEANELVEKLKDVGLTVYEILWKDRGGWSANVNRQGMANAMCGFSEVVKMIYNDLAINKDRVCAHGNGYGATQLAFGLAKHNLEDIVDFVVYEDGPISSLASGCFGSDENLDTNMLFSGNKGTRELVDRTMGWNSLGHCKNKNDVFEFRKKLEDASVVSRTEERDFDNLSTEAHFIENENKDYQAMAYYNELSSEKYWHTRVNDKLSGELVLETIINNCLEE